MSRVHIITSSSGTPFLEELINEFLRDNNGEVWIVRSVFMTPGGYVAAVLQTEERT
jgi:hypothetical protein